MNILVTGSNGFIGKHLCKFLEEKNHNVYKVGRKNEDSVNFFQADLSDIKSTKNLSSKLKNKKIDVVIHLASKLANVNQTQDEQVQVLIDNIMITKNMFFLINTIEPQKLINFSSMAVYPNIDGCFTEESQIKMSENSDCMYGLSKFCSENIFDCLLKNKNLLISHLRISQVYGEGMYQDRIIPVMIKELKEKNTITIYGNGNRTSDFIHINKLLTIINDFIAKDVCGTYNIGDELFSYEQLAKKLIKESGNKKSSILKIESGAKPKFQLDKSKLIKIRNEV